MKEFMVSLSFKLEYFRKTCEQTAKTIIEVDQACSQSTSVILYKQTKRVIWR